MNDFENLNDGNASFENKRAIATTELDASHDQKPKAANAKLIESATDIMYSSQGCLIFSCRIAQYESRVKVFLKEFFNCCISPTKLLTLFET